MGLATDTVIVDMRALGALADEARAAKQAMVEVRLSVLEHLNGMVVTIPFGRYRDRKGEITDATVLHDGEIGLLIQPLREDGRGFLATDLLDARTYWRMSAVSELASGSVQHVRAAQ